MKWATGHLEVLITACPQIVRQGIGAEAFVEDLRKAAIKFTAYPSEAVGAMQDLLPYIAACPQIFSQGIGVEAFADELSRAAAAFAAYTQEPRE